ncbi:hypothetical protein MLD38_002734 [Melastoma candidum]|uniref:Uncharacterized protein n=1 Tax=Melastoma candidum TaxID=119954 RepID=A0ACB9S1W3_9MYRT|nr:hypothetical protein MLD38_002734 [Melastoma candidum]
MAPPRKIIDQVSGWLTVYDDGTVDRTWTGPPEVKFMAEPVPPHEEFVDGVATRDVLVDGSPTLRLRVYLPEVRVSDQGKGEDGNGKLPILLHFHGGGFCISQPDWYMYHAVYTGLVKSAPAICVSPYLRLAPENKLPAAIDDGYAALKWLRSLALGEMTDSWLSDRGDFDRIFLIGDSSGGNVVHAVAARAGDFDLMGIRLAGAIPIHPGFVRKERSRSEMERPETPFLTRDMAEKFLALALPEGADRDHQITSPMGWLARPLRELRMPPVLLCLAENDLILDTEMEYYEAMKQGKHEIELLMSHGMTHSFYLNRIAVKMDPETAAQTNLLFSGIADFINRH